MTWMNHPGAARFLMLGISRAVTNHFLHWSHSHLVFFFFHCAMKYLIWILLWVSIAHQFFFFLIIIWYLHDYFWKCVLIMRQCNILIQFWIPQRWQKGRSMIRNVRNDIFVIHQQLEAAVLCHLSSSTEQKKRPGRGTERSVDWMPSALSVAVASGLVVSVVIFFPEFLCLPSAMRKIPGISVLLRQECLAALLPWTPSFTAPQGRWCHNDSRKHD